MNAQSVEVTEEQYKDFLNETYPEVKIGELTFSPGDIIQELDEIAFRCGLSDYATYYEEWECGYCGEKFDDEEEAEACCKEDGIDHVQD